MSKPLVSVVIPCYRQGHYLPQTLEDVFAQSYPNIEVVLVNDGSDDDTAAVAERYRGRIRYVWQSNAGLSAARNTGIAHARGKYLFCLDSDDRIHPDAIGWLVEAAAGRDDVLCVMGSRHFEIDGELGLSVPLPTDSPLAAQLLTSNLSPPHGYLSVRERVVALGGFDQTLRSCEDWDMWLRLLFAGAQIMPVWQLGAYYRQHPQSMSRNQGRMAQTRAEVMSRTLRRARTNPDLIRQFGADPVEVCRVLTREAAREHLHAGYHLRQNRQYRQSLVQYALSVRRGGLTVEALLGVCKLLPHRLMHLARR